MNARKQYLSLMLAALLAVAGCGGEESDAVPEVLRIYHSPYGEVDWTADLRLKGQHHDHIGLNIARIQAYDAAGYNALSLMDYSGAPDKPHALKQRYWPVENFIPAQVLQALTNIKIWFPGGEEIGVPTMHVGSSFLPSYIEPWNPALDPVRRPGQYASPDEMMDLIRAGGGLPVIAHPWWEEGETFTSPRGVFGIEIYSAFAEARRREGVADYASVDRNRVLVASWDRGLALNQSLIGFAVNDHFGPMPELPVADEVRDSGKVLVLAKAATLEAYRSAVQRGAVLAVRDMGRIKDRYPVVSSIAVESNRARIETDGQVSWITAGNVIGSGGILEFTSLPSGSRYVRAEIRDADSSVVYTQAFWVRPMGDADGDGVVTDADRQICDAVARGAETDPDRVAACRTP